MRKLFIISTAFFWLAMAGFWLASLRPASAPVMAVPTITELPVKNYSLGEVAMHGSEGDCWMAIDSLVYDITAYLPDHPSEPELILPWCGKEATQAWQTKGKGRSHSSRANHLLERYRIGVLR